MSRKSQVFYSPSLCQSLWMVMIPSCFAQDGASFTCSSPESIFTGSGFLRLVRRTTVTKASPVRLEHRYEVRRGGAVICEASSTLACVGRDGKLQALPDWLGGPDSPLVPHEGVKG